ncbi:hypothetical protein WHZ77_22810 [Bradyrhizobium sp. A5]|uniref:hypothetical protein n=1 Tax=Bradyrhizobium sp. A5 TaxID=3133696 RepID=UPI0032488834
MQQDVRKNYISIVNDASANEQAADTVARSRPGTVKDLVDRLAGALKRRLHGAASPPIRR